ncbi:MAG TPA: helix-turn-helix transcriptional regulator [Thermoanaerobaculia bacterium]|nr:helix-turn-helix transcriptional regulator [Thermoanaerobaculia bacterium]
MNLPIGQKLRNARREQGLSLQQLADQAHVSIATLSRIETHKQSLDIELFVSLAGLLKQSPSELLTSTQENEASSHSLMRRISSLDFSQRMHLWSQLAATAAERGKERKNPQRQIAMDVEELLAQMDFLRAEIAAVSLRLRRP